MIFVFVFPGTANAANLKPNTRQAWEEYIVAAKAQMKERLGPDRSFLLSDEIWVVPPDSGAAKYWLRPQAQTFRNEFRQG